MYMVHTALKELSLYIIGMESKIQTDIGNWLCAPFACQDESEILNQCLARNVALAINLTLSTCLRSYLGTYSKVIK